MPLSRRTLHVLPALSALMALVGLVAAALLALPPGAAQAAPGHHPAKGLPDGVPAAATRAEPALRAPHGWPFAQRLSHTSGTGRLFGGASYWSDFVYDDHGAALPSGVSLRNTAMLAPTQGAYTYPGAAAHNNGADVFVAATGLDAHNSYWRVDWNTLADPTVPLAVWTFDTDGRATTGVARWPADAHVSSPGIDRALIVSSRGAWLENLRTGRTVDVARHGGHLTVDRRARSFVVRVPRSLMPVNGHWKVRLGAGLAAPGGRTLAAPTVSGAPEGPGSARLYNVAFRSNAQEPAVYTDSQTAGLVAATGSLLAGTPLARQLGADGQTRFVTGNFWSEDHQADALARGDVAPFSRTIDWDRLSRHASTPEPLVHGSSNRWFVSRLHLGQGVVADSGGPASATGDGKPNFLGRIQPYAVYVPKRYQPSKAEPLTWILHSLSVNHNQYAAYDPHLLQQLCERRDSICATTLGYGPDGWYFNEAESDYWAVWGALAHAYSLDPSGTVITGYSMGGWATYHLGLEHPDLYAAAVTMAGPPHCGVSLDDGKTTQPAFGGRCTSDGSSVPLVRNARWVPYRIAQGTADELVPFTSVEAQVRHFDQAGLRYRFLRYPAEDHLVFATQDRFDSLVKGLGHPRVVRNPRTFDYTWRAHLTQPRLGIGATTAYWTSGLSARRSGPGTLARVRATSSMLPGRAHRVVRTGPRTITAPLPAVEQGQRWVPGKRLGRLRHLTLRLTNVRSITVDLQRARLSCGAVTVSSDGPVTVRLTGAGRHHLGRGRHTVHVGC